MTEQTGWPLSIWAGLIGIPLMIAGGQALFKLVGTRMPAADAASMWLMLFDPYFIAAMVIYAIATVGWILVLRSVPLAAAYSFSALGFLFVPFLSFLLFGEPLTGRYFAGAVLITAGLAVIHA
jgi:undecaprenyl phosphate-alpha-L-ara4N flippase subunit ArnE